MSFVQQPLVNGNGSSMRAAAGYPEPPRVEQVGYVHVGSGPPQHAMEHSPSQTGNCLENVGKVWASALAIATVTLIGGMYNLIFLRRILPAMGKRSSIPVDFALFNTCWLMTAWSYIAASCKDPGQVPNRWLEFVANAGSRLVVFPSAQGWQPGLATTCDRCGIARPERTHHCKVCDRCVVRMDHHCPWIANCVGFNNYKHFILLIFYAFIGIIVGLCSSLPELVYCGSAALKWFLYHHDSIGWQVKHISNVEGILFLAFGVLSLVTVVLLSILITGHAPLLMSNRTAIELHYAGVNPYDTGAPLENFEQQFGLPGWDWFLPIQPRNPAADGIAYPPYRDNKSGTFGPYGMNGIYPPYMDGDEFIGTDASVEARWSTRYRLLPMPTQDWVGQMPEERPDVARCVNACG